MKKTSAALASMLVMAAANVNAAEGPKPALRPSLDTSASPLKGEDQRLWDCAVEAADQAFSSFPITPASRNIKETNFPVADGMMYVKIKKIGAHFTMFSSVSYDANERDVRFTNSIIRDNVDMVFPKQRSSIRLSFNSAPEVISKTYPQPFESADEKAFEKLLETAQKATRARYSVCAMGSAR